jgi:succinyl-diaminopimelate desuccinylase
VTDLAGRVLDLTRELISRASVTPDDAGCLELIGERLRVLGFNLERIDAGGTSNLWATLGTGEPVFAFAGHTDVVPTGPLDEWESPPFEPSIRNGFLYGRGAADMKASLAAMVVATEEFVKGLHGKPAGTVAYLLTSDEEGPGTYGTKMVMERLTARGVHIDRCIVGEPSSSIRTGDVIRTGRRGSLNLALTVRGIQGHVAYPEQVDNPIHRIAPALAEWCAIRWDEGSADFPPTSMQVTHVSAGAGAVNVVPGELRLLANFRFSNCVTEQDIQRRTTDLLARHGVDFSAEWSLSGHPFLTPRGDYTHLINECIRGVCGHPTEFSTSGGTSDGRFIAPTGTALVELGPVNATIHKVNERVALAELEPLTRIYLEVLRRVCAGPA